MNKALLLFVAIVSLSFALSWLIKPSSILHDGLMMIERKMAGLEVNRVVLGDVEIEYSRGGKGEVLLLLHGFGADKDNWNRIATHLVPHFDVIALDLPGFGNSSVFPDTAYDLKTQLSRIHEFTKKLHITKFHIAGNSMGGYFAGNYAAQYPAAVSSVWLISPFGADGSYNSEMFRMIQQGNRPIILPKDEEDFSSLFHFLFYDPPFIPAPVIKSLSDKATRHLSLREKIFEEIHRMKEGVPNPDSPLNEALAQYCGPIFLFWGKDDKVLDQRGALILKQEIPNIFLTIDDNIGHLPMLEQPENSANKYLAFIDEAYSSQSSNSSSFCI